MAGLQHSSPSLIKSCHCLGIFWHILISEAVRGGGGSFLFWTGPEFGSWAPWVFCYFCPLVKRWWHLALLQGCREHSRLDLALRKCREASLRFLVAVLLWQLPKLPNPIQIAAGLWHDGKMCAAGACITCKRHIMNTFRVKDGLWEMTGVNNALMLRVCTAGVAWLLLTCSACGLALQKPWWGGRNCCFV